VATCFAPALATLIPHTGSIASSSLGGLVLCWCMTLQRLGRRLLCFWPQCEKPLDLATVVRSIPIRHNVPKEASMQIGQAAAASGSHGEDDQALQIDRADTVRRPEIEH
jgi:hypothetical protein